MKVEYPKWVYKEGEQPVIVQDEQEHKLFSDDGYTESPEEKQAPKKRGRPARSED